MLKGNETLVKELRVENRELAQMVADLKDENRLLEIENDKLIKANRLLEEKIERFEGIEKEANC